MQREDFLRFCQRVQIETYDDLFEKLKLYEAMLVKWQKAINLVAPSTLPHIWQRHLLDSLQLVPFIPAGHRNIVDIGSGAGFPGLVLAIARPDLKVACIESDRKKTQFLKNVSRETNADVTIFNERIERTNLDFKPDLLTARALASLDQLCSYMQNLRAEKALYLKGETASDEIIQAQKNYAFHYDLHPSRTAKGSHIVSLTKLRECG